MTKSCPHCHCEFECRNDNVLECDCVHVILTREALAYISDRYSDCLCVNCLQEINRMPDLARPPEKTGQYAESERYDPDRTLITNHH